MSSFHSLKVGEVRREIADAISLRFEVPEELNEEFRFTPGQHLTLRTMIDGKDVRRNYSICSSPQDNELRVAIKQISGGTFSTWANASIACGQMIEVMPPHGSFTWAFNRDRAAVYVGFAGGSGITPILSLLKTALQSEPKSVFILLYGNRTTDSVMFLEEIAALKDRFMHRLAVHHFLEDDEGEFELLNGRLDDEKMSEVLGTLVDPQRLDAAFICGPGPMMDAVERSLVGAGMSSEKILIERFTAGELSEQQREAVRALEAKAEGRTIKLSINGRKRTIAYHAGNGSILENARAAGLPAPFACKAGVCATCRAKVISGKVEMVQNFGLTAAELAQGYVLTCQAVPVTDEVELDYNG